MLDHDPGRKKVWRRIFAVEQRQNNQRQNLTQTQPLINNYGSQNDEFSHVY